MRSRIIAALAAAVTLVLLAVTPALAVSGPFKPKTHSGNHYCLGGNPNRPGTVIIQNSSRADPSQCRDFWFTRTTKTPAGNFSVGNFQTISARAELGVVVNSSGKCTGDVKLLSIGATGTAWILYTGVSGKMFLSPPACEGGVGHSDCNIVLSANNFLHDPWGVRPIGENGQFQNLDGIPFTTSKVGKQTESLTLQQFLLHHHRRCCVC